MFIIGPNLYKSSRLYDFFMKRLGFEGSIARFLRGMPLECAASPRILDAGCGTGLLGLHFLERFPEGRLHSTDLEPNFLAATIENAEKQGIDSERLAVGVANISAPHQVTCLKGQTTELQDESFDLICVGAVVGYADDTAESLRQLVRLLAPGGYLINIEMNESLTGRFVSHRYHYFNIPLQQMQKVLQDEGCEVTTTKFALRHFPAKLTRTGIVARKPVESSDVAPLVSPA